MYELVNLVNKAVIGKDEFAAVAEALSGMAERWNDLYRTLEQQVGERTRRAALHQLPRDRDVLSDAVLLVDRAQSSCRGHGLSG